MDGITSCYSPGYKDLVRKIFLATGALQLAFPGNNPCAKTVGALLGVDHVCYNTPENVRSVIGPGSSQAHGRLLSQLRALLVRLAQGRSGALSPLPLTQRKRAERRCLIPKGMPEGGPLRLGVTPGRAAGRGRFVAGSVGPGVRPPRPAATRCRASPAAARSWT